MSNQANSEETNKLNYRDFRRIKIQVVHPTACNVHPSGLDTVDYRGEGDVKINRYVWGWCFMQSFGLL